MSKDIWHTKKEKPMEDKTVFAQHKSFRDGCIECFMWEKQEFTDAIRKDVIAWTYLDDLLALETDLERTRKALDGAKNAIESAKDHNVVNCVTRGKDLSTDDVHITLCKALEQIIALEQKD